MYTTCFQMNAHSSKGILLRRVCDALVYISILPYLFISILTEVLIERDIKEHNTSEESDKVIIHFQIVDNEDESIYLQTTEVLRLGDSPAEVTVEVEEYEW